MPRKAVPRKRKTNPTRTGPQPLTKNFGEVVSGRARARAGARKNPHPLAQKFGRSKMGPVVSGMAKAGTPKQLSTFRKSLKNKPVRGRKKR